MTQSIKDIKFENGHDIDRMAQMIYDLRNALKENQQLTATTQIQRNDAMRQADEAKFAADRMQDEIKAKNVIIENFEEEQNALRMEIDGLRNSLVDQARLTSDAALQVSEARRAEAHVEREYRTFAMERAREFELLQTELRNLDKIKRKVRALEVELSRMSAENLSLAAAAESRFVFRRPIAYFARLRNRLSPAEA